MPDSPEPQLHSLNWLQDVWTSYAANGPNPDSDKYITICLCFGANRCYDLQDVNVRCVMTFIKYPTADSVFMRLSQKGHNEAAFTWLNVRDGIGLPWGSHGKIYLDVLKWVNVSTLGMKKFVYTAMPGKIKLMGNSFSAHETCNWVNHQGMITNDWLIQTFHQVWFSLNNELIDNVNFTHVLARMCFIPCTGQNLTYEPLTRYLSEFLHAPCSHQEAVCVAYHVYMAILLNSSTDKYIIRCKKAASSYGLPVALFGDNGARLCLLPPATFIQFFCPLGCNERIIEHVLGVDYLRGGAGFHLVPPDAFESDDEFPLFLPVGNILKADFAFTCVHRELLGADSSVCFKISERNKAYICNVTEKTKFSPLENFVPMHYTHLTNLQMFARPLLPLKSTRHHSVPSVAYCNVVFKLVQTKSPVHDIITLLSLKYNKQFDYDKAEFHNGCIIRAFPKSLWL
jgi:hypothetical protein